MQNNQSMNHLTFITSKVCPYARKAALTLSEKSSQFKVVEEDLNNKSQFFKESYAKCIARNPQRDGAVPILIDGETYLCESQPIVWYVAEKYQKVGNNIIPEDHVQRFKMRIFINEFSKVIPSIQSGYFNWPKKTQQQKEKQKQDAQKFFEKLNEKLVLPYAIGEQFTVADILLYTHLELWDALEHFTGLQIYKKFDRVQNYIANVQHRESVKRYYQPKEEYIKAMQKLF